MGFYRGPNIVTDGLVFAMDAGSERCYDGTTTINSLVGSSTGTLTNGVTYQSINGGVFDFDGSDDYISLPASLITALHGGTEASICIWIKNDGVNNSVGASGIIQLSGFNNSNGNLWFYSNGYTYLDIFRT